MACFPSLRAWLSIEVKEWTLAERIDDNQFEAFLTEAAALLHPFVASDGVVAVPAPAYIVVASK
jgi:hypothetical protein